MILFPTLCSIRLGNARIVNPKEVCLCVKKSLLPAWWSGEQALSFTSGSFAYGHFHLWNIDPDFCFAFGAVQREIKYHCILAYFGSGLAATNGTVNPLGILINSSHILHLYRIGYSVKSFISKLSCWYEAITSMASSARMVLPSWPACARPQYSVIGSRTIFSMNSGPFAPHR